MIARDRLRRRALIKLLAETGPFEEGSLLRHGTAADRAEGIARAERAGAYWVAYHRGIAGYDKERLPHSRGRV